MSAIYIYKLLIRSSAGSNPWCWDERWIIAKSRKHADKEVTASYHKIGGNKAPVFIKKKKFIAKKHGAKLPRHWVDAPRGYFATRWCCSCRHFWMRGGCRDRFGDEAWKDEFCHYKKNRFWKPR